MLNKVQVQLSLQAILRLKKSSPLSGDGLIPTLADAVNYVMTTAQAVTIISLTAPAQGATAFAQPPTASRRLMQLQSQGTPHSLERQSFLSLADQPGVMNQEGAKPRFTPVSTTEARELAAEGALRKLLNLSATPAPAPSVIGNTLDAVVQLLVRLLPLH